MSEGFRIKCSKCGCEWDSRVPEPNYCKFCRVPMSESVKRRKEEYNHRYNREHPEIGRRYFKGHPEVIKAAHRKRRALKANSHGNFTAEEFGLLCDAYENKCAYCGNEALLVPDHAIPLSRGGSNCIGNIVPSCSSCNSKKGTKTSAEFVECFRQELDELVQVRAYMKLHPDVVEIVKRKHFPPIFLVASSGRN